MPFQFHFENLHALHEEGRIGHEFRLRLAFAHREGARLHWIERSDRPYDEDMLAGRWVDMHAVAGARLATFLPWLETSAASGAVELDFVHRVGLRRRPLAQRRLEWWVLALDGPDPDDPDDEERDWALWCGEQRLQCDGAGIAIAHDLEEVERRHGRGRPPYPPGFAPPD
ncbi:hypothetical protein ABU614_07835 [Lysobacter firmicutimachus]|uniref:Uncharacterized protein n=1 Tax=Lysobacter firmicutimachus TaxID=1792846 RepID=A0AAU8MXH1_9GAMM